MELYLYLISNANSFSFSLALYVTKIFLICGNFEGDSLIDCYVSYFGQPE